MEPELTTALVEIAYAAGIGVFIGLEREHADVTGRPEGVAHETVLGVRTFGLVALLGWVAAYLGDHWPWMPPAALVVVGGLVAAKYVAVTDDRGLTTEVAAIATAGLGMLVHVERSLAVALALLTTLLLIAKPWFRTMVPRLRRVELTATLQLAIAIAVVVPLLPSEPIDPWGALRPRELVWFVVLIGGISYVGYFASRFLGEQRGAGITGLVGGLASSTAVTAAMSQRARQEPAMRRAAQLAVLLANAVMFGRVLVVSAVLSRELAVALALPLGAMGATLLVAAALAWRSLRREPVVVDAQQALARIANPFAIWPALTWGAALAVVLLVAEAAQRFLGHQGLIAAAAASGLADVDAITVAVARRSSDGSLAMSVAAIAVTVAVVANTVVKGGIAVVAGGRPFARDILLAFGAAMVLGLSIAALA